MKAMNRWLVLLMVALGLPGCALTGNPSAIDILAPSPAAVDASGLEAVDWSVQIQRPVADQMRDSDRVLVRRTASRLQVYPGSAWLDSAPEMLQSLIIQAFADSQRFSGVGRSGGIRTRYGLSTELRNFEAVDQGDGLRVDISLLANLVHQRTGRSLAGQTFSKSAEVSGPGVDALVGAFEQALSNLLPELLAWVLEAGTAADAEWTNREDRPRRSERPDR